MHIVDEHFVDIIEFLSMVVALEAYTTQQKKELVVKAADFSVIAGNLYKMGSDEVMCRYVSDYERKHYPC